jgi:uncharacterized protein (DUF58 family)
VIAVRFDQEFLKALDHLRLASRRTFAGSGRGDRRGRHRGRGIEFADYRPYAQGDDFRHIDWKAYKRLGRLLLRLFDEDQDLAVYLLLDTSGSMATAGKFDYAVRLAGALCYIGAAHLDRVTVLPFAGGLGGDTTTGRARQTVGRVFEALESLVAEGTTDLGRAVSEFAERPRRAGLAVVISDFLDAGGAERALRLLTARGHDVVVLHVVSAADRDDIGAVDDMLLEDAETGQVRRLEVTPRLARAYREAWVAFDADVAAASARSRAIYLRMDVAVPFDRAVLFTLRQGRLVE